MKDLLDVLDPDAAPKDLVGSLQTAYQTVHWTAGQCTGTVMSQLGTGMAVQCKSISVFVAVVALWVAFYARSQRSQLSNRVRARAKTEERMVLRRHCTILTVG